MAVLAGTTVRNSVTELVPAERIEGAVRQAHLPVTTFLQLCDADVVEAGQGSTTNLTRENGETVPAGGKTEGDEFTIVEYTTDEESITPTMVGYRRIISKESIHDASRDIIALSTRNAVRHLGNRLDVDGLALVDSITLAGVDVGTAALTDDDVLEALRQFNELHPTYSGQVAIVLNPKQILDWSLDLKNNGGHYLGSDAESAKVAQLMQPGSGFKGVRHGMLVFMSANLPVATGEATGAIMPMGPDCPLALRSWQPLEIELEPIIERASIQAVYSLRYGVGIGDPDNGVRIISDGA